MSNPHNRTTPLQRKEAAPGAVISINLVSLKGGIAESASASFDDAKFIMNLQPATAEAGFDMRLPPMNAAEMDAVERMIREEWAPASLNFSVTFTIQARAQRCMVSFQHFGCTLLLNACLLQAKRLQPDGSASVTSTDAAVNPWWGVFKASMAAQGLEIEPDIFPAATDASYLRVKGIPSLGFSPMRCVPADGAGSARRSPPRCSVQAHAQAPARARRVFVGGDVRRGHRHLRAPHRGLGRLPRTDDWRRA